MLVKAIYAARLTLLKSSWLVKDLIPLPIAAAQMFILTLFLGT